MLTIEDFKPGPHDFIEGERTAHMRAVLNDYYIPALILFYAELREEGRALADIKTNILPTLNVDCSIVLRNGKHLPTRVQWVGDNIIALQIDGIDELKGTEISGPIVEYKLGEHQRLAHALSAELARVLGMLNDPSMYCHGGPEWVYA